MVRMHALCCVVLMPAVFLLCELLNRDERASRELAFGASFLYFWPPLPLFLCSAEYGLSSSLDFIQRFKEWPHHNESETSKRFVIDSWDGASSWQPLALGDEWKESEGGGPAGNKNGVSNVQCHLWQSASHHAASQEGTCWEIEERAEWVRRRV